MKRGRQVVCALGVAMALVLGAASARAAEDTTGKVSIEVMSVGAGLGYSWGEGVLLYRGEKYPFTVTGFAIGDVGVAKLLAKGEVHNLTTANDFAGVFMAAMAGGTLGGGGNAAVMQNQNGTNMVLVSRTQGLNFSLAQAGMTVKFTEEGLDQVARNARQPAATPRTSP